jgi:hypothetical protein
MGKSQSIRWARLALVAASAATVLLAGVPARAEMATDGSTPPGLRGSPLPAAGARAVSHARQALAGQPGASAQGIDCWRDVSIFPYANHNFVSTETGYSGGSYGMLRARATTITPSERFMVCRDTSTGLTILVSQANEKFVSTEIGYSGDSYGMLRARANIVGPWELYYTSAPPNVRFTHLRANANGHYVSAEIEYPGKSHGMLRARAAVAGPRELYYWYGTKWTCARASIGLRRHRAAQRVPPQFWRESAFKRASPEVGDIPVREEISVPSPPIATRPCRVKASVQTLEGCGLSALNEARTAQNWRADPRHEPPRPARSPLGGSSCCGEVTDHRV